MVARAESITASVFDCRYGAEKLTAVLQALDEAAERTSNLHSRLGTDGVYALISELLPHAIQLGHQLTADLRQLEGEGGGR
jgi:hypothetical protein